MAVNTLVDNNFLIVDEGTANAEYFNKSWCSLDFTDEAVIITDQGRFGTQGKSKTILFTDFQYDSVAYSTKATIFGVLKDKIGA